MHNNNQLQIVHKILYFKCIFTSLHTFLHVFISINRSIHMKSTISKSSKAYILLPWPKNLLDK